MADAQLAVLIKHPDRALAPSFNRSRRSVYPLPISQWLGTSFIRSNQTSNLKTERKEIIEKAEIVPIRSDTRSQWGKVPPSSDYAEP